MKQHQDAAALPLQKRTGGHSKQPDKVWLFYPADGGSRFIQNKNA
jgi:hypothetical protein